MALELAIVTPERVVFEGLVDSVVAPGAEGRFGVLAEHEHFLAPLRSGVVTFEGGQAGAGRVAVSSGFAEVTGAHVTLLVQTAELASEIDAARAEASLGRAEQALAEAGVLAPEGERERLEEEVGRARARLEAANP